MKLVPLLAVAIAASGYAPVIAGRLLYEFNFSTPADLAAQGFSYQTDMATVPGSGISGVPGSPALAKIFRLAAGGDPALTGLARFGGMAGMDGRRR